MAEEKKKGPAPSTQRPPPDEVDASKGVFPYGVKHPEGAEVKSPGSFSPYEESGSSGLDAIGNPEGVEDTKRRIEAEPQRPSRPSKGEPAEPKGNLPAHR